MRIAVLGAGAFGTSLAKVLAERGQEVVLWVRTAEGAAQILRTRESSHLPGAKLGENVGITHDLRDAVHGSAIVLAVTPSHVVREVMSAAAFHMAEDTVVVNASKGIEQGTLATIDQIYREVLPPRLSERAAFLSGPTFAKELVLGLPAAIVVAAKQHSSSELVQAEFATERLRVYSTDDVTGVEIAGALKNIMAIGAGISDGLGFGHNTRAALITRGLNEIARLGVRLGANPLTFAGLAGMGDLVLTCTGDLSRNRQVGLELGKGRTIGEIVAGMNSVAEGVKTTKAARDLAHRHGVDVPIIDAIFGVLYDGKTARDAVAELLRREARFERD